MKYGCIGEHLKHSFSKEIHNSIADYEYEIREILRDELPSFMRSKDFKAINVTIPYKEAVIPFLDYIDENAKTIGAANTVINKDGRLFGYNTDFFGMRMLLSHANVQLTGKKVVILGTGGTSKTAAAVSKSLSASEIIRVSRSEKENAVSYVSLYENHTDADVIINTTPSGMFPNIFDTPVDLSKFHKLSGVIDAVYNPIRTPLIEEAKRRGINAEGGLYMLVSQAVLASELFLDTEYPKAICEQIYKKILSEKENIVLVGMPSSGKSTVGKILAEKLGRRFVDTDEIITLRAKKTIPEIFKSEGEEAFRELETLAIKEASALNGAVIATGGGSVLREKNVSFLRENGKIFFIDRPLSSLIPTDDRPLSKTKEEVEKLYKERYGIYKKAAYATVDADCEAQRVSEKIEDIFYEKNIRD